MPPGMGMNMNMKKEGAVAAIKLKALQWDKINYMAVGNTVWGSGGVDENALQKALGDSGVFGTMEQLFVAKVTEYKGMLISLIVFYVALTIRLRASFFSPLLI